MSQEKKNALFTVSLIAAVLLVFTVADFLSDDRLYSSTENRLLAEKPEFSPESLFSGIYTEEYENYVTDQFVSRDKWIAMKTYFDIALGKQEIGGVYLGKENYLIERHLPEEYPQEAIERKTAMLRAFVEEWDAEVMLVPTADNVLTDKLPGNAPVWDQERFLGYVGEQLADLDGGSRRDARESATQSGTVGRYPADNALIDVMGILRQHAAEDIYYRTDHHWTTQGAYYGYLAWAEAMGVKPYPYEVRDQTAVSENFLGTLHSKINISWKPDSIFCFPQTMQRTVQVTYDSKTTTDTLYEEAYLETKNQYGYFLDDNHALVEIITGYETGKTLLVVKDSYANCFVPFLLPHYDKITMIDPRYYNAALSGVVGKYPADDVLVLYNCVHFLDDFVYDER